MPFTIAGKNKMLNALGVVQLSLHTADPGTAGDNEANFAGYARKDIDFGVASAGALYSTDVIEYTGVPVGVVITHICLWDAEGSFVAYYDSPDITYAAEGNFTVKGGNLNLNG